MSQGTSVMIHTPFVGLAYLLGSVVQRLVVLCREIKPALVLEKPSPCKMWSFVSIFCWWHLRFFYDTIHHKLGKQSRLQATHDGRKKNIVHLKNDERIVTYFTVSLYIFSSSWKCIRRPNGHATGHWPPHNINYVPHIVAWSKYIPYYIR